MTDGVNDQLVTVVIPSLGRSELVRTIESVRNQTHRDIEIIVVLDTAMDEGATATGADIVLTTGGGRGAAVGRNMGVAAASGRFVAFLDDDDWWEATKIEQQIASMTRQSTEFSYTATYFHSGNTVRTLPITRYGAGSSMGDYLVLRPGLRHGHGYVQSSSIMLTRRLAQHVAWDESLSKHQDWDLVVRLEEEVGEKVSYVDEPLVHVQQASKSSISTVRNWRRSVPFYDKHASSLGKTARGDFIATQILRSALAAGDGQGIVYAASGLSKARVHPAALIVSLYGAVEFGKRLRQRVAS